MEPRDPRSTDDYARGSFTFRRMTRGQVTGLIIALVILLIALIWWA